MYGDVPAGTSCDFYSCLSIWLGLQAVHDGICFPAEGVKSCADSLASVLRPETNVSHWITKSGGQTSHEVLPRVQPATPSLLTPSPFHTCECLNDSNEEFYRICSSIIDKLFFCILLWTAYIYIYIQSIRVYKNITIEFFSTTYTGYFLNFRFIYTNNKLCYIIKRKKSIYLGTEINYTEI